MRAVQNTKLQNRKRQIRTIRRNVDEKILL